LDPKTLDRLSIIYRKSIEVRLQTGEADNKWSREVRAILEPEGPDDKLDLALTLSAINMAIWQRQDELRQLNRMISVADVPGVLFEKAGQLAFDLLKLNDWRNELAFPGEKLK
jgi:hypothetical protein